MAIKQQHWKPDTMRGITFVQEYDDTDFEGTLTCVGVIDRGGGVRSTSDPAQAQALHAKALGNNQFKNRDVLPALIAQAHADEIETDSKGNQRLIKEPRFDHDANDDLVISDHDPVRPETKAQAQNEFNRLKGLRP